MKYNTSDCLGRKFRKMSRLVDDIYRKHLKDSGITESQLDLLLYVHESGKIKQADIGKGLGLERSTVSRNLNRLIDQRYFSKTGDAAHPVIKLTAKGKKLVEQILPGWEQAMDEILLKLGSGGVAFVQLLEQKIG